MITYYGQGFLIADVLRGVGASFALDHLKLISIFSVFQKLTTFAKVIVYFHNEKTKIEEFK